METLHEVQDLAKVDALAASMERHGWQGAPIVVDGGRALTGVHRIAAYERVFDGLYGIPAIDVEDVFAEAGLNWAELVEENEGDWAYVLRWVLPEEQRQRYGIDVH